MAEDNSKLRDRLANIWMPPNFTSFFKTFAKNKPLNIKRGNSMLYEGDEPGKIYFINRGFVKLYRMSPEGRDTIIYLYGPGSILGLRALTSKDKLFKHTAQAITDVEVVTLSEKEYLETLEKNPEYLIDLMHAFIERLNHTERKLEGFILTDSTARVASFLSDVATRFGESEDGKVRLPIELTHQTISEFVGAFRETVTVAMNRLKKEGILEDQRGKITILDLKKLQEHALI